MNIVADRQTRTGGRVATTRYIPPKLALAVGMPTNSPPKGWRWVELTKIARLESGHTPSRNHPEYWGGDIPWIGIVDARIYNGRWIDKTIQTTNSLGIANSSARVLPKGTVCLSRTASVGYVVVMGRPMATSQDFVNWVCSDALEPDFLRYLFVAEGDDLLRFASGSVHSTIYFPEAKAFHIAMPTVAEQRRIVSILDEAFAGVGVMRANAARNLRSANELLDTELEHLFRTDGDAWRESPLESVVADDCSLSYGIVQPGDEVTDGLPIVRPTDLTSKIVDMEGLKRIDPKLAEGYRRTTLKGGDLLLCVRGTTGTVAIAVDELAGANVTRGIVPIRFRSDRIEQSFGYYLMRSGPVQAQIRAKTYGTALMQINIADVRKLVVRFPTVGEQARIFKKLETLDNASASLCDVNGRRLLAFDELRKSLLHQAFSGAL